MTTHPRLTMAAIAVGASFAISFGIAMVLDGGGQQLAFAVTGSGNNAATQRSPP